MFFIEIQPPVIGNFYFVPSPEGKPISGEPRFKKEQTMKAIKT
jgi:hypothetical protein